MDAAQRGPDRGMVTAELAAVFPVVILLLVTSVCGLGLAIDQLRCVDAARVGARAASRGDPPGRVLQLAHAAAPGGASVDVQTSGSMVRVSVRSRPPVLGSLVPQGIHPSAAASARLEVFDGAP